MSQPEDVRVRRTRKLLRETLVGLIEEKGFDRVFDRVAVAELAERATISRAAFFEHIDAYHRF